MGRLKETIMEQTNEVAADFAKLEMKFELLEIMSKSKDCQDYVKLMKAYLNK